MPDQKQVAIIGAGPAGLMVADVLSRRGVAVSIYDAMPSFGRKFLMAGKSGLNITHAEAENIFVSRYNDSRLEPIIEAFGPSNVRAFMDELGIEAFTGPTGRVFPTMMKASPLLRAWLARLRSMGVVFHTRHRWLGWDQDGTLRFETQDGPAKVNAAATILALGGASWKRLGSDGVWAGLLTARDVQVAPFRPSNCGFLVDWSPHLKGSFAGAPLKGVALSADGKSTRGECVITARGIESGAVYTLSAQLRAQIEAVGNAALSIDLLPDMSTSEIAARLARPRGKQSLSSHLRKTLSLKGAKVALIHEVASKQILSDARALAGLIKALPLQLTGMVPLDEAISTVGGVEWSALNENLMLRALPNVYCVGEMVDWDAPTGGYLLTACMAMGAWVGNAAYENLSKSET